MSRWGFQEFHGMPLWWRKTNHGPHYQPLHKTATAKRTGRYTIVGRADNILIDAPSMNHD